MFCLKNFNLKKCVGILSHRSLGISATLQSNKNVAVILSGCGVYDGTEIIEAVSCMVHLSRHNAKVEFFAPDKEQLHVINHSNGEVQTEVRNAMFESARITRGSIKNLESLKADSFQALIIPGGFGVAKNLSDYALQSNKEHFTVNKQVERILMEFTIGLKPIGLCCIAPILAAKILPECEITIGKKTKTDEWPYADTFNELKLIGASLYEKDVNEIQVDQKYRLVTTPAFMKNATYFEVFNGIGKMIDEVFKLTN